MKDGATDCPSCRDMSRPPRQRDSGDVCARYDGVEENELSELAVLLIHFKMTQSQQCGHRSNAAVR